MSYYAVDSSLPAFVWLIAALLVASPLVYLGNHLGRRLGIFTLAQKLAFVTLAAAWVPFWLAASERSAGPATFTLGTISLSFDGLSLLVAAVVLVLSTMVVIFSGRYLAAETGQGKFYAMLLTMSAVMIGLACAADLFNLWLWFEAMAVSSYLLVTFYRDQPASLEAGVKYLIQSAAGSTLVLVAIALVLGSTGTLDLAELRTSAVQSPVLLAAGALFVIGYGVKAALVPLHTWLPDAHSQAPSGISALLSGIVIEAGLVAMLRSLGILTASEINWGVLLMSFGVLNMVVGNLMALRQKQVKRMLAYSSLTHVGYMLIGIGIAVYAGNAAGAQGGLFHLFNHGLMKGLAFLAAGAFLYTLHLTAGEHGPLTTRDLAGAATRYPWAALALSLALLSLGGLPPLAGFMSKWQIFTAGFQTHNLIIGLLVIFAALNSVFSLAYYAPLVNTVYRQKPSPVVLSGTALPFGLQVPLVLLAVAVIVLGFWPSLMNWLTEPAGAALLNAFGG
jgi:proton-translocating NADH-quinone oxidoreductase chain N